MDDIDLNEGLWRSVFYGRQAKAAGNRKERKKSGEKTSPNVEERSIFMERIESRCLSVDRHDDVPIDEAVGKGDKDAEGRPTSEGVCGWLIVRAKWAAKMGRKVVPTPTRDNPQHVDIVLPKKVQGNKDEWKQHAQHLASSGCWEPRPEGL